MDARLPLDHESPSEHTLDIAFDHPGPRKNI